MNVMLNRSEKKLREQLKKEIEIPDTVLNRIQETCRFIQDNAEDPKIIPLGKRPETGGNVRLSSRRWFLAMEGTAAALAVGILLCMANPALAGSLPVIGNLFELLQDKVFFFGNYSDRATVLTEPSQEAADGERPDNAEQNEKTDLSPLQDGQYTKTCDGLTITLSEVYANDQAIYLTLLAQSEEPFPETEMAQSEIAPYPVINIDGNIGYSFLDNQTENGSQNLTEQPQGTFLDDSRYACILRLDLAEASGDLSEYNAQSGELSQEILDELGLTKEDLNEQTESGYDNLSRYLDELSSRNGQLPSSIHAIPVPNTFTLTLDIQQFMGHKAEPEYWDSGYTQEELTAMSDEEWMAVMAQEPQEYQIRPNVHEDWWYEGSWKFTIPIQVDEEHTETLELNDVNEAGIGLKSVIRTPYEITINDVYEEGADSDTFLVALDANGNRLPQNEGLGYNFAIQDRDISTVDVYILDYTEYMDELKGVGKFNGNENRPEEEKWGTLLADRAKYHKTLHFS